MRALASLLSAGTPRQPRLPTLLQQPQLRKFRAELEFGYKVKFPGLAEKLPEAEDMTVITDDMKDTWIDGVRDGLKDSPLSGLLPDSMK